MEMPKKMVTMMPDPLGGSDDYDAGSLSAAGKAKIVPSMTEKHRDPSAAPNSGDGHKCPDILPRMDHKK